MCSCSCFNTEISEPTNGFPLNAMLYITENNERDEGEYFCSVYEWIRENILCYRKTMMPYA